MNNFQKELVKKIKKYIIVLAEYSAETSDLICTNFFNAILKLIESYELISKSREEEIFISQLKIKETEEMLTNYRKAKFRQKGGSWELRYRINGNEKSFTARTQTECKQKFDEWHKDNIKKLDKPKSTTLNEWFNKWLEVYKKNNVALSTYKSIINMFNKHILSKIGDKPIKNITKIELQQLIYTMTAEGNTRKKVKFYLNDIFREAVINKVIRENVALGLKDNAKPHEEGVALNKQERAQLINAEPNSLLKKYYVFVMLSGCRRNEALALMPEDILKDKIRINNFKTKNKTKINVRYIPLFSEIKLLLDTIEIKEGERIFPFNFDYVTRLDTRKKFIPNGKSIKDLRTTFATVCYENGVDTKIIQKWLGHTTDTMTKERYIKVNDEFEQKELSKMKEFFPKFFPTNSK